MYGGSVAETGNNWKTPDDPVVVIGGMHDELVATSGSDRNWKGMLIACLVISTVLGLILLSVWWLTPPPNKNAKEFKISLNDFLSNKFTPKFFNGTWISDFEMIFRDKNNQLILLDVKSFYRVSLINNFTLARLNPKNYYLSPDRKYILMAHHVVQQFRHSYWAKYTIWDIESKRIIRVTGDRHFNEKREETQPYLQFMSWSKTGNAYIFIWYNNIFYCPSVEEPKRIIQLTNDGIHQVIFNGIPDWIYEEEILSSNKAFWISPLGHKIAYIQFNDTLVEEIRLPHYTEDMNYPKTHNFRYSKSGSTISIVKIFIVDLSDLKNIKSIYVKAPGVLLEREHYITHIFWVNEEILSTSWINREQNLSLVAHCEMSNNWTCTEVYRESVESGWSNMVSSIFYSKTDTEFLIKAFVLHKNNDFFRHIIKVKYGNSSLQIPITYGAYDVIKIHGWDQIHNIIYYEANGEENKLHKHIYSVSSNSQLAVLKCLTCQFVTEDHSEESEVSLWLRDFVKHSKNAPLPNVTNFGGCLHNIASFSEQFSYWTLVCQNPQQIPSVILMNSSSNSLLRIIEDNSLLRLMTYNISLPIIRTMSVRIPQTNLEANVKLYLPEETLYHPFKTFPLLLEVYAGPGIQSVTLEWKQGWASYLSSHHRWIVALIDGRGSGKQSEQKQKLLWKKLGNAEIQDQISFTSYLARKIPIIDMRRIGIWGWSYGGYAALKVLSDPTQSIFQCATAVAPVTDWLFYDAVYSERYLGRPENNLRAYQDSNVMKNAVYLHSTNTTKRNLYLIHGTMDDNVHLQHSMILSKVLAEEGIMFKQQIYSGASHNFRNVKNHLYKSMELFFESCFKDDEEENDEKTEKMKRSAN